MQHKVLYRPTLMSHANEQKQNMKGAQMDQKGPGQEDRRRGNRAQSPPRSLRVNPKPVNQSIIQYVKQRIRQNGKKLHFCNIKYLNIVIYSVDAAKQIHVMPL